MSVLMLEGVCKSRLSPQGRTVPILSDIDLILDNGLVAIVGPSGGGKSTLLRLLNRLEEPSRGRIFFDGQPLVDLDPLQLRRRIALVAQKPFMFSGSVLENLQKPFLFAGQDCPGSDDERLCHILSLCQLPPEMLMQEASTLSGGQQQRVSLARSLLMEPKVLLLDEPTSALDRPTADRLSETLRSIGRSLQLSILLVTHDLCLAGRVADRMIYLEDGRVVEDGEAAALLTHPQSSQLRRFLAAPECAPEAVDGA